MSTVSIQSFFLYVDMHGRSVDPGPVNLAYIGFVSQYNTIEIP